jgi:hypothetical protein
MTAPGVAHVIVTFTTVVKPPPGGVSEGELTVSSPLTRTGVNSSKAVDPLPHSPSEFDPQHQTEPSAFNATL